MKPWQTIGWVVGLLVFCIVVGVRVGHEWPPSREDMQDHFARWEAAVEAGDWPTAWAMWTAPMPNGVRDHDPKFMPEDLVPFVRKREAASAGLSRSVAVNSFTAASHVDDPFTYRVLVTISYIDPASQVVVRTEDLAFWMTERRGQFGMWGFSSDVW